MSQDNKDLIIKQGTDQIVQKIVNSNDLSEIKDLTNLFNINQCKKQALRVSKYNQLLDKLSSQIQERLQKKPDQFSNSDLIDYFKTLQASAEKSSKSLNTIDQASAIVSKNNPAVNINIIETVDRDSRQRITDVIKALLSQNPNQQEGNNEQ